MELHSVENIVERLQGQRGDIIAILQAIQSKFAYLPEEALKVVAQRTGRSLVDVYGVATFYRAFSLQPRGQHLCSVCVGTACHVRGAPAILEAFERKLHIKAGQTTPDRAFTLETVNCLGACALGPVVVMDGRYFSNVRPNDVSDILDRARNGQTLPLVESDKRIFPVDVGCPHCNHSLMDRFHPIDGCSSIRLTVSFGHAHGWLRLSSLYGSFAVESEHEIPMETVLHVFCPHCHAELNSVVPCSECSAPMVPLIVREGGIVQICTRRGCKGHMLDLA